jgi:hypothetical protein
MFSPPPPSNTPRYDIKQNYAESIRAGTILGVSSLAVSAALFGLVAVKSVEAKLAVSLIGIGAAVTGKLASATLRERTAILGDVEDVSAAARTTEITHDMSPVMTQAQPVIAAMPTAVNPSRELHRSAWVAAKEAYQAGTPKNQIIEGWGYTGSRYKLGQQEWHKLLMEFGDFETAQQLDK